MRTTARQAAGLAAAFTLICGCSFDSGGIPFDEDAAFPGPDARTTADAVPGTADARADAAPGTPDAAPGTPDAMLPPDAGCPGDVLTVGISNIAVCDIPTPLGTLTLNDDAIWYLSTETGVLSDGVTSIPIASALVGQTNGGPMVRVVAVTALTIDSSLNELTTLAAFGPYPLAIVSFGNISIDGFLYAGADGAAPGPGGNAAECGNGTGRTGAVQSAPPNGDGGAGGGGGGYGTAGANGGKVGGATGNTSPTQAGMQNGNSPIGPLRGGCAGGAGGNSGGPGGGGGGAVQLIAENSITINGFITARGGGGRPPQPENDQSASGGGGGGGSGGALLFEASAITVTTGSMILAQGGGGGQGTRGGGTNFGGGAGENGHSGDTIGAAGGDSGVSAGGVGGTGAATANPTVGLVGVSSDGTAAGGGGGGGGLGRIRMNSPSKDIQGGSVVNPPPA